jgi:hypothetical protein
MPGTWRTLHLAGQAGIEKMLAIQASKPFVQKTKAC